MRLRTAPWLVLLVPALLLGFVGPRTAQADRAETERRLEREGVAEGAREAIHDAIERGVAFLVAQQRRDGGFGPRREADRGVDLLCALALRHANLPAGRDALALSRETLFPEERKTLRAIRRGVWDAGLAAMFIHADRGGDYRRHAVALFETLVKAQGKEGSWTPGTGLLRGTASGRYSRRRENLASAEFACLGLHACGRFVSHPARRTWARHLESLVKTATPDGSWPYEVIIPDNRPREDTPKSSPAGTCMGLANLLLAEQHLGDRHGSIRKHRTELTEIKVRARRALARHARYILMGYRAGDTPLHSMYALQKVCVLLGVEDLGGLAWYREGAQRLVRFQGDDGGWNPEVWQRGVLEPKRKGELVNTAYALLFLLRSTEVYRPTAPSPVDLATLTPAGKPMYPEPPTPPRTHEDVTMSVAYQRLHELEELLVKRAPQIGPLHQALEEVIEAYPRLAPDPATRALFGPLAARWRSTADQLFLDAFARVGKARGRQFNRYADVNRLAAQALRLSPADLAPDLQRILAARHLDGSLAASHDVLGEAFDTLAHWGQPASARWLVEELLDGDRREDRALRAERLLWSLGRFAELPGDVRRDAVERILRTFEGTAQASVQWVISAMTVEVQKQQGATVGNFFYWQRLRYAAMLTVHELARDPATGEIPRDRDGMPLVDFTQLRGWYNHHKKLNLAPWK